MKLAWHPNAWEDYLYWQQHNKQICKRINLLIMDTLRHPLTGLGKPKPLRHHYQGAYSRRITSGHRLVYMVTDTMIIILQCRYHYQ